MTKSKQEEPAVAEDQQVALLSDLPEWANVGNKGSEEVTAQDMVLPRIDVIQALSPQLKKSDERFIPDAEQGDIFNSVTGTIYGRQVVFVPVMFRKEWVVWKLRKHGGGFLGAFKDKAEAFHFLTTQPDPAACEAVESHQQFGLVIHKDGTTEEVVFSLTKSKLKASRTLNSLAQIAGVERFAKAYTVTAVEAKSDKGDFWSIKVTAAGYVPKPVYDKASGLYELIKAGAADVDRGTDAGAEPAEHEFESATV